MKRVLTAVVVTAVASAGCYWSGEDGRCDTPGEDRVWVVDGNPPGFYCFDDGDGYPTIFPSVTLQPPTYPTTGV